MLDTLVVRKISVPFNPEFGVGAIAPGDVIMISRVGVFAPKAARDTAEVLRYVIEVVCVEEVVSCLNRMKAL